MNAGGVRARATPRRARRDWGLSARTRRRDRPGLDRRAQDARRVSGARDGPRGEPRASARKRATQRPGRGRARDRATRLARAAERRLARLPLRRRARGRLCLLAESLRPASRRARNRERPPTRLQALCHTTSLSLSLSSASVFFVGVREYFRRGPRLKRKKRRLSARARNTSF